MSEINLNEVVEEVVDDATVITVPIDDTLSVSGEAADAKAVGDAAKSVGGGAVETVGGAAKAVGDGAAKALDSLKSLW